MARSGATYRAFRDDESGAVAIDWVALTAGVLLLGTVVVYAIFNANLGPLSGSINTKLADALPWETVDSDDGDGGENTGNAAEKACVKTEKQVVCMGPV